MKKKNFVIVAFLLVAAMTLGVGYATLTTNLMINGNANFNADAASEELAADITFLEEVGIESNGSGATANTAVAGGATATYTVNSLIYGGEYVEYTYTIQNTGNIGVNIVITDQMDAENSQFDIEYLYGDDDAATSLDVAAGGTGTIVVKVTMPTTPDADIANESHSITLTATTIN